MSPAQRPGKTCSIIATRSRRCTSWKAIASYLGREVRTVMRWEKERGLPIHRGPGGRSGVVFADMDELDAWTRGHKAEPESALLEAAASDYGERMR